MWRKISKVAVVFGMLYAASAVKPNPAHATGLCGTITGVPGCPDGAGGPPGMLALCRYAYGDCVHMTNCLDGSTIGCWYWAN